MKKIYVILFFIATCSIGPITSIKNKKKSLKTTTESSEIADAQPAIIAIEIVDPNENSTSSKNSKRTIESALGYGYNSYDTSKPRYEIYKYSQHDIPPYNGDAAKLFKPSQNSVNIQKSVQYTLPTVREHVQSSILSPGTTLYSSLGEKGQVGGLKSSLSQLSDLEHNQAPVPVVVLRIYPDQLKDSTIQANLPDSHPFAKVINKINIQSLLSHYIKALQKPTADGYQYESAPANDYASNNQVYYTQQSNSYEQPQANDPQNYQYHQQSYPQQSVTYQQQQQHYSNNVVQVQEAPLKYNFRYQSPAEQDNASPKQPMPQYYYVQPNNQASDYSTPSESSQYYQPPQQLEYASNTPQYQNDHQQQQYQIYYQTPEEQQQYVPKTQKLLTTENYPTNKHTRVIFRTKSGKVRSSNQDESAAKEIKTIKIQVPDNIAKVEVEESKRPYYTTYQPSESQQGSTADATQYNDQQSNNYYIAQGSVQQGYYSDTRDRAADDNYQYQNVDYDEMQKYITRRGAMPNYFFQGNVKESRNSNEGNMSAEDMMAAYEDAAFPSTTISSKKKVKSKKRT